MEAAHLFEASHEVVGSLQQLGLAASLAAAHDYQTGPQMALLPNCPPPLRVLPVNSESDLWKVYKLGPKNIDSTMAPYMQRYISVRLFNRFF